MEIEAGKLLAGQRLLWFEDTVKRDEARRFIQGLVYPKEPFPGIRNGRRFEIECLGFTVILNEESYEKILSYYRSIHYMGAVNQIKVHLKDSFPWWNPDLPPEDTLIGMIFYFVREELRKKDSNPNLQVFPALGYPLDLKFGVDCYFKYKKVVCPIDITTFCRAAVDDKKPDLKIVYVCEPDIKENCEVEIKRLVKEIVYRLTGL